MTLLLIVILAAIFLALIAGKAQNRSSYRATPVMSAPEQVMYFRLKKALPAYEVLAQVPFGRFLRTRGGTRKENFSHMARARQKVADYLICKKNFEVIAAVELDDSSHNQTKDAARDKILSSAGIPTIRCHVRNMPSETEIQEIVSELLQV